MGRRKTHSNTDSNVGVLCFRSQQPARKTWAAPLPQVQQELLSNIPQLLSLNNIYSDNKNQIELFINDGLITCKSNEDYYIAVIRLNTLYSFYQVIEGYNNNFAVFHNGIETMYSIPFGNIDINTIIDYFNSIIITYDKTESDDLNKLFDDIARFEEEVERGRIEADFSNSNPEQTPEKRMHPRKHRLPPQGDGSG